MKRITTLMSLLILIIPAAHAQLDYSIPDNWVAHPMKTWDVSREPMTVSRIDPDTTIAGTLSYSHPTGNTGVDIFYVYPTLDTILSQTRANLSLAEQSVQQTEWTLRTQVGLLAQFGKVYAPWYRQVNLQTFSEQSDSIQLNLMEFALQDVEAAFDHYLANHNNGNKIILVGHSQGSVMLGMLLRKRFDNDPALRSKLVAAIIPGLAHSHVASGGSDVGGFWEIVPTCQSRPQCGCIMPWRSFKEGQTLPFIGNFTFIRNSDFQTAGLIYDTYAGLSHNPASDTVLFGAAQVPMTAYLELNTGRFGATSEYLSYENAYRARSEITSGDRAGLMVEKIDTLSDLRNPLPHQDSISGFIAVGYHIYDFQIIMGDLIDLLQEKIDSCAGSISGIDEAFSAKNVLEIWPNPARDLIQVRLGPEAGNGRLEIIDMAGRMLFESPASDGGSELSVKTADWPRAMYLLRWKGEKAELRKRLLLE